MDAADHQHQVTIRQNYMTASYLRGEIISDITQLSSFLDNAHRRALGVSNSGIQQPLVVRRRLMNMNAAVHHLQ